MNLEQRWMEISRPKPEELWEISVINGDNDGQRFVLILYFHRRGSWVRGMSLNSQLCSWRFKSFRDLNSLSTGKQLIVTLCLQVFTDLNGQSTGKQLIEALCLRVFTDLNGLSTGKPLLEALCLQVFTNLKGLSTGKQLPTFRSSFVPSSSQSDCFTLNMKTQRAFESSVTCHQYTRRNAPEDLSPNVGCF